MLASLKERQIETLKCMINLNINGQNDDPEWKLLIYDQVGQNIIAPLFTVKDLRALGVTLHLRLDAKREAIPDVPAVYFVLPSADNINAICSDLSNNRYDSYYLNFISSIPRNQLEFLAETALAQKAIHQIRKVFDQNSRFVCLEDDLFVLSDMPSNQEGTFLALNRPTCTKEDIDSITSLVAESLFAVFATLGSIPIVRCSRQNAAEEIAKDLDNRFRDALRDSRSTLFSGADLRSFDAPSHLSFQRPLLIILDRGLDMATPLHHAWTYQSLIHDIVGITLNHIDLAPQKTTEADQAMGKPKRYDLSSNADRLWCKYRASPFSEVPGVLKDELKVIQDREKQLKALKASVGGEGASDIPLLQFTPEDTTSALTSTISNLPQLLDQKRLLDLHMHLATHLATAIKSRQLDLLNDVETKLLSQQALQEHSLADLIKMPTLTGEDKLRLLLVASLCYNGNGDSSSLGVDKSGSGGHGSTSSVSTAELNQLTDELKSLHAEVNTSAIRYVHHLRRMKYMSSHNTAYAEPEKPSSKTGRDMLNRLVSHGSAMFMESMRSIVGRKSYLPLTEIVAALMENKTDIEDYTYFDAKLSRRTDKSIPRSKQPFFDAYVFVVGGGTYPEYHNLVDWSRSTGSGGGGVAGGLSLSGSGHSLVDLTSASVAAGRSSIMSTTSVGSFSQRVTYGGTEMLSPIQFLDQLSKLGKDM